MPVSFGQPTNNDEVHQAPIHNEAARITFQDHPHTEERMEEDLSPYQQDARHRHRGDKGVRFNEILPTHEAGHEDKSFRHELNFGFLSCGHTYASQLPALMVYDACEGSKFEAIITQGGAVAEIAASLVPGSDQGSKILEIIVHAKDDGAHGKFNGEIRCLLGPGHEEFLVGISGQTMQSNKGTPMLRDYVSCIGRSAKNQTDSDCF